MRRRLAVRTLGLVAINVGIAAPFTTSAQIVSDIEIACDAGDALERALAITPPGGRIVIRSGTCTGNLIISRDVRIQGSGHDRVTLLGTDATSPVVTIPRGVAATISGVTVTGGRVGVLATGRAALSFTL